MLALRLGSYSIVVTREGTPCLSRLKSIARYLRLCSPPRKRTVVRPMLFRPPDPLRGSSRALHGLSVVSSSKSLTDRNRLPGEVGLYFLMPITAYPSVSYPALAAKESVFYHTSEVIARDWIARWPDSCYPHVDSKNSGAVSPGFNFT